jgi:hypothetical protein
MEKMLQCETIQKKKYCALLYKKKKKAGAMKE